MELPFEGERTHVWEKPTDNADTFHDSIKAVGESEAKRLKSGSPQQVRLLFIITAQACRYDTAIDVVFARRVVGKGTRVPLLGKLSPQHVKLENL